MSTLVVDEEIVPVVMRSIDLEKARIRRKVDAYAEELATFENGYGMSSTEFMSRYGAGELGDDEHWMRWEFLHCTRGELTRRLGLLEQVGDEGQNAS